MNCILSAGNRLRSFSADSMLSSGGSLDLESGLTVDNTYRPLSLVGMSGSLETPEDPPSKITNPLWSSDSQLIHSSSSQDVLRTINEDINRIRDLKAKRSDSPSDSSPENSSQRISATGDSSLAVNSTQRLTEQSSPHGIELETGGSVDLPSYSICVDSGMVMEEEDFCDQSQNSSNNSTVVANEYKKDVESFKSPVTESTKLAHNQQTNTSLQSDVSGVPQTNQESKSLSTPSQMNHKPLITNHTKSSSDGQVLPSENGTQLEPRSKTKDNKITPTTKTSGSNNLPTSSQVEDKNGNQIASAKVQKNSLKDIQSNIPPNKDRLSSAKPGQPALVTSSVPPSDKKMSPSDVKVPPSDMKVTPSDKKMSPSDVKVSPSDVKVTPSDKKMSLSDAKVSLSDVKVSPSDAKVSPSNVKGSQRKLSKQASQHSEDAPVIIKSHSFDTPSRLSSQNIDLRNSEPKEQKELVDQPLEPLLSSQSVSLRTKLQRLSTLYDCDDGTDLKLKSEELSGPYEVFKTPKRSSHTRSRLVYIALSFYKLSYLLVRHSDMPLFSLDRFENNSQV